jgi:hypothetical protein
LLINEGIANLSKIKLFGKIKGPFFCETFQLNHNSIVSVNNEGNIVTICNGDDILGSLDLSKPI